MPIVYYHTITILIKYEPRKQQPSHCSPCIDYWLPMAIRRRLKEHATLHSVRGANVRRDDVASYAIFSCKPTTWGQLAHQMVYTWDHIYFYW